MTKVRELQGHSARVSALSWNGTTLSSGGRDSIILNRDVRQRNDIQSSYACHQQEVCGLAWSPDGSTLVIK
jgi:cell division cycle protein 20 (cofactor of APC complex)